MKYLQEIYATLLLCGVDHIIDPLVDLRIGEVGRKDGHNVACVSNGVRDGFVCVPCVPFICAEGDQGGNCSIQSTVTGPACGEGLMVEQYFTVLIVRRW